jgi:hypothetical protein
MRSRPRISCLAVAAVVTCSGSVSSGPLDQCTYALVGARSEATRIDTCVFARTDTGAVIAYRDHDTLYFVRAHSEGTEHIQFNWHSGASVIKRSSQRFADRPVPAGGWPDAKQLYFPFDVANAIRDRVGQRGTGFVCIDPAAALLTTSSLTKNVCRHR